MTRGGPSPDLSCGKRAVAHSKLQSNNIGKSTYIGQILNKIRVKQVELKITEKWKRAAHEITTFRRAARKSKITVR